MIGFLEPKRGLVKAVSVCKDRERVCKVRESACKGHKSACQGSESACRSRESDIRGLETVAEACEVICRGALLILPKSKRKHKRFDIEAKDRNETKTF